MYMGRILFAQLLDFLPTHEFRKCVRRYQGHRRVRHFSCRDQFLSMVFAQLTYRESLRDIEACLRALQSKLYHAGIRATIARSTLADANERRDWRIYADFAQVLIARARQLYAEDDFGVALAQTAYVFDSTTIDLCLTLFPWARFRRHKAAVKLHTLLDLRGNIPSFIYLTDGKTHDVTVLDALLVEPGAFYVMDRGYIDFRRLYAVAQSGAFFVVRAKRNLAAARRASRPIDKATGLRSDQTVVLTGPKSSQEYPDPLRRVSYVDLETRKRFVFHQQLYASCVGHRPTLQVSLAGGAVLQMDQAVLADQGVLRDVRERGEDADLDRDQRLCARGHREETPEAGPEPRRNSPNSECHPL